MTFTEIQTEIAARLEQTSTAALARIGREINIRYRRVTTALRLTMSRRAEVQATATPGSRYITFSNVEKITAVFDTSSGTTRVLEEKTFDQLRNVEAAASDTPERFAIAEWTADTVKIFLDTIPQTAITLYADAYEVASTLSGSQEPAFPESFHDILIFGVMADELEKKEKWAPAKEYENKFEKRLSDLRMWQAESAYLKVRMGESGQPLRTGSAVSGGGSSTNGSSSYTQTGLITFDRSGSVPFAVASGSPYVPNLIAAEALTADSADALAVTTSDRLIGRDTAGSGASEELTVSGGLEFTGSGGVRFRQSSGVSVVGRAANSTGDVADITAASNGTVLKRTSNALTFAAVDLSADVTNDLALSNLTPASAASRLLGRGSAAGAGDFQEITLGTGLAMSGTTLAATIVPYTTSGSGTLNLSASNGPEQFVECTGTATVNLYALTGNGLDGYKVHVKLTAASATVTLDGASSETIDGLTTQAFSQRYMSLTLIARNSVWHVI